MIDLRDYKNKIAQFILNGLNKFTMENGEPHTMGIYSCPCNGWISLNFNGDQHPGTKNCPDFEFVEYDLIDFEGWSKEYENDSEWIDIVGHKLKLVFEGDEALNKLIFDLLKSIAVELKQSNQLPAVFLQMLDSSQEELID